MLLHYAKCVMLVDFECAKVRLADIELANYCHTSIPLNKSATYLEGFHRLPLNFCICNDMVMTTVDHLAVLRL